jgi:dTDP-glucose 4,6-dehydratase
MEKYFVIGSNSFSGSSLVKQLLLEGKEVFGVSRSVEAPQPLLAYKDEESRDKGQFTYWQSDLNHDLEKITQLITDIQATHIINFSAQGMVAESWNAPADWFRTNVMSMVKLTEKIRKLPFIKKFLQFSTPEVYGSIEDWTPENFHFAPTTPYAVSRAACDLHLRSYFLNYGFPVIFTRAANVFGPCQQLYRIVPKTIASIMLETKLELHGGGLSERSFINMTDVAKATSALLADGKAGETYHVSTTELVSIRSLVEKICGMMDYDFEKLVVASDERMGKDFSYSLDSKKIRSEINWSEEKTLEDGLSECIEWAHGNFDFIRSQSLTYEHKK